MYSGPALNQGLLKVVSGEGSQGLVFLSWGGGRTTWV